MTQKKKKARTKSKPASFEEALAEVEKIVRDLEEGKIGLAEALERYQRGVTLLKECYELLEEAEHRIQLLSGVDAEGNPVVEPFGEEGDESLEEKSQSRSRRRSTAKKAVEKGRRTRSEVDGGRSLF